MAKTILDAVREVCVSFPEVEEELSHGMASFRVKGGGKTFAYYTVNHHGDGRVALWLSSPPGAQEIHTQGEPKYFFVPPYVGPKGWLGVHLNKGLSWKRIAVLAREAYEKVAPPKLRAKMGPTLVIKPPTVKLTEADIYPMKSKKAQSVLKRLRAIASKWFGVTDGESFGSPTLKAGTKTFAQAYYDEHKHLTLMFWVGVDKQSLLTADKRFTIPKYIGHNGWISLDVEKHTDWDEIESLMLDSYRHFATRRMLARMS